MATERRARLRTAGLALLAAAALLALLVRLAAPPDGPVEPAWDRAACARCHMLVSEPRFAAQLHTAAGEVRFFDDPGCLLLHLAEAPDADAKAWFHDARDERWLADAEVGFVPAGGTPMGHGLAAVLRAETPGALSPEAALARLAGAPGPP